MYETLSVYSIRRANDNTGDSAYTKAHCRAKNKHQGHVSIGSLPGNIQYNYEINVRWISHSSHLKLLTSNQVSMHITRLFIIPQFIYMYYLAFSKNL